MFLPTGNPGGSFYGGDRPGDNLYAVSVLALDATTGAYKWHYQTTRHDLFDADLAAAPALIEVVRDGKRIPAVAQITKMGGMLFILDRLTGKPIHGVEDRKVPPSNVPGEKSAADAALPDQAGAVGALGHDQGRAHHRHARSRTGSAPSGGRRSRCTTTAPTRRTAPRARRVVFSGTIGGGNWGGVAFNPQLGYVFVNTSNLATIGRMVPDPQNPGQYRNELAYTRFWDDNKYPCQQPPWGELVAVNANTGDIAWKVPLGVYPELVAKGIPPTGTPNLGGPIATASGLRLHRRDQGRALPRLRREDRQGAVVRAARSRRRGDADDLHGPRRQAVRGHRRGRARRYRSRRHRAVSAEADGVRAVGTRAKAATTATAAPAAAPATSSAASAGTTLSPERMALGKTTAERICTSCHGLDDSITAGSHPGCVEEGGRGDGGDGRPGNARRPAARG